MAWSARRRLALDRADGGLLGGPGQLAAGRVGLAAIEELTRVLGAATCEEESMIQHGVPEPPFCSSSVDDMDIQAPIFHFVKSFFHFSIARLTKGP